MQGAVRAAGGGRRGAGCSVPGRRCARRGRRAVARALAVRPRQVCGPVGAGHPEVPLPGALGGDGGGAAGALDEHGDGRPLRKGAPRPGPAPAEREL